MCVYAKVAAIDGGHIVVCVGMLAGTGVNRGSGCVCVFVCIFLRGKIDTVKSDLFAADGRNRSTAGKPECLSGRISARLGRTWENRL